MAAEVRFRAMGSDVHVVAVGARPGVLEEAQTRIADLEQRWSRFIPSSEIARLNAAEGETVGVSEETFTLIERSIEGWRATGGLFDPTVLHAVEAAGYDRSIEGLPGHRPHAPAGGRSLGCGAIRLHAAERMVSLDGTTGFDPGGIGKGLAADFVATEIVSGGGADGICVNVGGDLRVAGASPDETWVVEIENPFGPEPIGCVELADGAVATTSRLRRRWLVGDEERHHIVDPRSGICPLAVAATTVLAAEGWWAEVLAKAAFLAPLTKAADMLAGLGTPALIVDRLGIAHAVAGMGECLT